MLAAKLWLQMTNEYSSNICYLIFSFTLITRMKVKQRCVLELHEINDDASKFFAKSDKSFQILKEYFPNFLLFAT